MSNFHTPFRHDISSTHSLPDTLTSLHFHTWKKMFTFQIISMIKRCPQKYVHGSGHIHDQNIQRSTPEVRVLPKYKVDDRASSKTHLVRFMHNVVTSKFKIFSVAKARCWNTRLSPKTPKVFPVLSSSSKIQFLG